MFTGHGTADDLLDHYSEAVKDLDSSRTWQVGMHGCNVNLALHKKLVKQRVELNFPCLLDLGMCGLHIIHGAFQTGAKVTNWSLDHYLLKQYKLFIDSPACHEDFVSLFMCGISFNKITYFIFNLVSCISTGGLKTLIQQVNPSP